MSEVDWPAGFERHDPSERTRNNKFDVTLARAFDDLESELERIGVDEYRYDFDAQQRKTDQRPYARASPDDPSFVLRWTMDGDQFAVACDRWSRLRDNVRSVGLYLREKRKMESRAGATGQSEFANARLPSGEDDDEIVAGEPPAHQILGVDPDASEDQIIDAYRELLKEVHPDQGGDQDAFQRVKRAKEVMLGE